MAATWSERPSSPRQRFVAPMAVTAVVLAVIGACVAVVGHHTSRPASNADLLRLVRSASGALDNEPSRSFSAEEQLSGHGLHETITMSGVSSMRQQESSFRMVADGVSETGLSIKKMAYLKIPRLNAVLNNGKDWLAIRAPKPDAVQQQLQSSGPASLLNGLATVSGTVRDEGRETVNGVDTTKYRFDIDAMKLLGSTFSALLGPGATTTLEKAGFDSLPMTLWLDDHGLPRELEIDLHVDGITMHETGYMTPSSKTLALKAPPASDVHFVGTLADFGRMLQDLSGSAKRA